MYNDVLTLQTSKGSKSSAKGGGAKIPPHPLNAALSILTVYSILISVGVSYIP